MPAPWTAEPQARPAEPIGLAQDLDMLLVVGRLTAGVGRGVVQEERAWPGRPADCGDRPAAPSPLPRAADGCVRTPAAAASEDGDVDIEAFAHGGPAHCFCRFPFDFDASAGISELEAAHFRA